MRSADGSTARKVRLVSVCAEYLCEICHLAPFAESHFASVRATRHARAPALFLAVLTVSQNGISVYCDFVRNLPPSSFAKSRFASVFATTRIVLGSSKMYQGTESLCAASFV